jgi:RimJ/RimL family protein N-acetyltransferase
MSNSMIELLRTPVSDRSGDYEMSVRLLQKFGELTPYLDRKKIAQLWKLSSQHEVLFSDHTDGKVEPFLDTLFHPRSIWYEFFRLDTEEPVGVAYVSRVIPFFDADAHIAFWDGIASGRQPVVWEALLGLFDEFRLRRVSAAIPIYQTGTIRFVKKLGFQEEGQKREAVVRNEEWFPQVLFGITREELEEVMNNG